MNRTFFKRDLTEETVSQQASAQTGTRSTKRSRSSSSNGAASPTVDWWGLLMQQVNACMQIAPDFLQTTPAKIAQSLATCGSGSDFDIQEASTG